MKEIFAGKIDGKEIEEGETIMINVPSSKLTDVNSQLIKWYISRKDCNIVYVTVNKPLSDIHAGLIREGIDKSKVFIIDAITPRKFADNTRVENAVFIGSPKELTNISISTTSTIKNLKGAKVLIFDSVSTLLAYNDFDTVREFISFISNKMKELKVTFAIICIKDKTDEKIISKLTSFVDKVLNIE